MVKQVKEKIILFFRELWLNYLDYDRVGERKIFKSIRLWNTGSNINKLRALLMYNHIRKYYNCNIYPGIKIGTGCYIAHASWVAIGRTAEIGNNCKIYSRADITAKLVGDEERTQTGERRHAIVGDNCILGNGCLIVGPITIGDNVIIGAGAIVTKDVPSDSVVIGINQIRPKS